MHRVNTLSIVHSPMGASKHVILKKLQGVQSSNFQNVSFVIFFSLIT